MLIPLRRMKRNLVAMKNPALPNLDLGRPITWLYIVDYDVMPISPKDVGCYCYLCLQDHNWDVSQLEPLTPSTGVFTTKVRCDIGAPVFVCLEHIPFQHTAFEAFTPDVAQQLQRIQHRR